MPLSMQTKNQITTHLMQVETCSADGDLTSRQKILAPDVVVFAPGLDQHGRDGFTLGTIHFEEMEIKSEGVIAWVSGTCVYADKQARFTAVLRGTGHAWELTLLHIA